MTRINTGGLLDRFNCIFIGKISVKCLLLHFGKYIFCIGWSSVCMSRQLVLPTVDHKVLGLKPTGDGTRLMAVQSFTAPSLSL